MKKEQKTIAIVAAGALILYLIYRWQRSQTAGSSATGAPAGQYATGSDFATLAGQEQSDVAALQGQGAQLLGMIQGNQAQEQSDISGLTGVISGLTSTVAGLQPPNLQPLESQIAGIAAGVNKISRVTTAQIPTHKGGPFYKYYVKVTGHAPPATVTASNAIYNAWKSGISAAALQRNPPHPAAPKQTQVAHPNGNHTQQSNVHRQLPKPNAPAPKPKPKVSGRRK